MYIINAVLFYLLIYTLQFIQWWQTHRDDSASQQQILGHGGCIWLDLYKNSCPDLHITFKLYTPGNTPMKQTINLEDHSWQDEKSWLQRSIWNPYLDTMLVVHGYNGSNDKLPIDILRDAFLRAGEYNVIVVDWSPLCREPCYSAAINNMPGVAKCIASAMTDLSHQGLAKHTLSCSGLSLGAHVCGVIANYLPFRLKMIFGLDPALLDISTDPALRLDMGDADYVQVVHSNVGVLGTDGRQGHMDVWYNGGIVQAFCGTSLNMTTCSHEASICYLSESLFIPRLVYPCTRSCPPDCGPEASDKSKPVSLAQATRERTNGTFCASRLLPPYCPSKLNGNFGDPKCCKASTSAQDALLQKLTFWKGDKVDKEKQKWQ